MAKEKQQGQEVNTFSKGLYTDSSYLNQPPETYTFALNAVNVTNRGDEGWLANEESNEQCYHLPTGYIPLGKVRISATEQIIFSTSLDEIHSEIALVDNNCNYTTLVNGILGFKINKQISASYRLRRGCERTLYFSTPTPMIYNIDAPLDFKTDGEWDINKFRLFKIYEVIPSFESIEILENGGLDPGSYNASIQYLDADLNPTEWITTCEPVKIYNDSASNEYVKIRGSINQVNDIINFGITNKSIRLTFGSFDSSYSFYRVAIIAANTGNGQVSSVTFSAPISTAVHTYTYSGLSSAVTLGTEEEIIAFNNIIEEVKYVEQIENRLILSGTKGIQVNFCNLQKYASKIKADLQLRSIRLNTISPSNPKTSTVNFDGTGYMPGEIYSFGIVYIFEDSSLTPVYHIPGRATAYSSQMSLDNKMDNITYTSNDVCSDYWGIDSEGNPLVNTLVRHHRFPLRSQVIPSLPLYTEQKTTSNYNLNYLSLKISDVITAILINTIEVKVLYTLGTSGTIYEFNTTIIVATYNAFIGISISILNNLETITVTDILEGTNGGTQTSVGILGVRSTNTGLSYLPSIIAKPVANTVTDYNAQVMTVTFSGIEIPTPESTNGHRIVGYYIVRNERDEDNKTILDTGVLVPMLDTNKGFVAHGHLYPTLANPSPIKLDIMALIHPEHKFRSREYKNLTNILQEGYFARGSQMKSVTLTQDVGVGTSYDPSINKKGEADYDGYSLHTATRDTEVSYVKSPLEILTPTKPGEVSYLNALNFRATTDSGGNRQQIYNVSGDNKIGIVQLDAPLDTVDTLHNKLPYVLLKRNLANPYGNFQVLPYFKDVKNPTYFAPLDPNPLTNGSVTNAFNGDSYITSMRYTSAVFYAFRLRERSTKSGTWKIITGALEVVAGIVAIVVGVVGSVFTGGTSLALVGVGIAAIGAGVSSISSGIEINNVSKVYSDMYDAGLRDTIVEDDTLAVFGNPATGTINPTDDEFQWLVDTVTNLWFESNIDIGLRYGVTAAVTDFLDSPDNLADAPIIAFPGSNADPQNELDFYALEKLTTIDTANQDGRLYKGYSGAEVYFFNPDYARINKQKVFYTLGFEYDCCSECNEDFPHRNWYSEQSFQEELTDNFRTFLPNNYKDIEGEKGVITDVFRIKNNLFIQTEEALWHLPQNIQERITGDVVSFIGTGSFFSIPPRLIEDSDYPSAGTTHNWARLKTASGVLFVSENDRKIYMFNGESVVPISSIGNSIWFKNNMEMQADAAFRRTAGLPFPMANNPSNKFGTGYISAYDTSKERFLITKKDYILSTNITDLTDYNICSYDGDFIVFEDYQATIDQRATDGWLFEGIEYCRMKFSKTVYESKEEIRIICSNVASVADIHYFLDTSGSFGNVGDACLNSIVTAVNEWALAQGISVGRIFQHVDSSERWVNYASVISASYPPLTDMSTKDIIVMSFCNEANPVYHANDITTIITPPTATYTIDYNNFVNTIYPSFKSFNAILYPIVFGTTAGNCGTGGGNLPTSRTFVQQCIAALVGRTLSLAETTAILTPSNLGFPSVEFAKLATSLQGTNLYPLGLENYGWQGKWDRAADVDGNVINSTQFNDDITELLAGTVVCEEVTVIVETAVQIIEYVEGVIDPAPIAFNNSWTMSYSLKDKNWIGWHSYLPSFYMDRNEAFYAWTNGEAYIMKYNKLNHYQTFNGIRYPHIIEYVDNKFLVETKLTDYITLKSEAKQYSSAYQDYVDKNITFNKVIGYNSKQTTGEMTLVPKIEGLNYLYQQTANSLTSIIIEKREQDWYFNDLRDIVIDYSKPLFRKDRVSLASHYFIDKVVNQDAIDPEKDWYQLQSLRDKYLVLRFIFDNFDNTRLITNYTKGNENISHS
jgi:hypothetical protein